MEMITILLRYILLYAIIMCGSIFISYKTNKKIEKSIVIYLLLLSIILYIFGIVNLLLIGTWIVSILSLISGIYVIIKKKKEIKNIKIPAGVMLFTILYFVFMITTMNKYLKNWDQYTYWSLATKKMYYTDALSTIEQNYPPIPTVLEYFFMKVIGVYKQGIEIFAVWMLEFSILISLFYKENASKLTNFLVGIICICVPAIFPTIMFYESSYADALVGLFIAYITYMYFYKYKTLSIEIILPLIALTITKPTGFYIVIILLITFIIYEILKAKIVEKQKIIDTLKSKQLIKILILVLIIITTFMSWQIYFKLNVSETKIGETVNEKNKLQTTLNSLTTTLFGIETDNMDEAESIGKLTNKLYSTSTIIIPTRISIISTSIILLGAFILINYKNKEESNKKIQYCKIASIFIGLLGYTVFLQLAYILIFPNGEMIGHNGIDRYMATYLFAIACIIIAVLLDKFKENKKESNSYIILTIIVLIFTQLTSITNVTITSGIYNINSIEYCNNGRIPAQEIQEKVEDGSKIISIAQDEDKVLYNLMIRYYLYPKNETAVYSQIENDDTEIIQNIKSKIAEENYKYIYIFDTDSTLNNMLNEEFTINDTIIQDETLYKIVIENEEICLEKVD